MKPVVHDEIKIPSILLPHDLHGAEGVKGRLLTLLQYGYVVYTNFNANQGALRAAALTYTTVLSLVPFLAIAFSILKGLGAQNALEPLLLQVAGDSEETISKIISYVDNTNVKSLGAIGLLALVMTVVSLLGSIEEAFNKTWGVTESRSFKRRFSDYLSVMVVGPILLLLATSMTSGLQSQWLVQWLIHKTYLGDAILILFRLIPYVSIWIATVFLYIFIPNTKVNFVSALLGGVLAGTSWQLAQWGYFHFQVGVANYNAIYGTLAALPVFMVWIYTSWLIILFGLEIVRVHQYRSHGAAGLLPSRSDRLSGEELAIALLIQVCRNFHDGLKPPTTSILADSLGAQFSHVNDMLVILNRYGYLALSAGSQSGWLPACEPSGMRVNDIVSALRGETGATPSYSSPSRTAAEGVLRRSREAGQAALSDVSIHDLLSESVEVAQQPEAG